MGQSILVLDDEVEICRMLQGYLLTDGYEVDVATTAGEARHKLQNQKYSLALIDLGLPDGNGLALARDLSHEPKTGVIIVSGRSDVVDRVVGLEAGADDYVTKPFEPRELLARVRGVLRRVQAARADQQPVAAAPVNGASHEPRESVRSVLRTAAFSGFKIDFVARTVTGRLGNNIRLTYAEFDLLAALVRASGEVVTRKSLTEQVFLRPWRENDRAVDRLVVFLRQKLGDNPTNPRIVVTVRGTGYRLLGGVTFD